MPDPQIIYLETGEEITSIVDRLRKVKGSEAVLVVPQGAILLQSIVNLKLLLRQSQVLKKKVRLVTGDRMGKSLAAQVGLDVFDTLDQLRVGGAAPTAPVDIIPPGRSRPTPRAIPDEPATAPEPTPPRRSRGPRLPRRPKLLPGALALPAWLRGRRTLAALGGGGFILLLALFYFVLPSATVHLTPKADALDIEQDLVVDVAAKDVSVSPAVIPGTAGERTVEGNTTAQATGKKDLGVKASGSIKLTNTTGTNQSLVSGTRLSSAGLIYRTNSAVTIPSATLDADGNKVNGTATVAATADEAGTKYNLSGAHFTIPGLTPELQTKIYGDGTTGGGTTREVSVVSQSDVDAAKEKLTASLSDQGKKELTQALGNVRIVPDALQKDVISATPSPAVDAEASSFTLQMKLQLKTIGFKESDLERLLADSAKDKIGSGHDVITEEGKEADVTVASSDLAAGTLALHGSESAFSAQHYDAHAVAGQIKGKSLKAAQDFFKGEDAISEVKISIWPSFKGRLPYFTSRIKIKIEAPKH